MNNWFVQYRMVGYDGSTWMLGQDSWAWPVYAGNDGSILVHVRTVALRGRFAGFAEGSWVRLRQTWHENGYWGVSIKTMTDSYSARVHLLAAHAFRVPALNGRKVVMHLDGDKDNNTPENLKWGSAKDNRKCEETVEIQIRKQYLQMIRKGIRIELNFDAEKCSGTLYSDGSPTPLLTDSGAHPGSIVNWLIYLHEWSLKNVSSPYNAMPEKNQEVFEGEQAVVGDCEYLVARPIGFKIPNEDAPKPKYFSEFGCAYSQILIFPRVRAVHSHVFRKTTDRYTFSGNREHRQQFATAGVL